MACITAENATRVPPPVTDQQDCTVARELLSSIDRATGVGLHSLEAAQPGQSVYVCANAAGARVALDVDSLIRDETPPVTAQDTPLTRVLHGGVLAAHVNRLLAQKDGKNYPGGPYAEVVSVLVCDDPGLTYEQANFELASVAFGPHQQIASAYLFLPYDPLTMSHPVVPVRLRR